jgi:hypothetical protein
MSQQITKNPSISDETAIDKIVNDLFIRGQRAFEQVQEVEVNSFEDLEVGIALLIAVKNVLEEGTGDLVKMKERAHSLHKAIIGKIKFASGKYNDADELLREKLRAFLLPYYAEDEFGRVHQSPKHSGSLRKTRTFKEITDPSLIPQSYYKLDMEAIKRDCKRIDIPGVETHTDYNFVLS